MSILVEDAALPAVVTMAPLSDAEFRAEIRTDPKTVDGEGPVAGLVLNPLPVRDLAG